jgi:hypothetical protein
MNQSLAVFLYVVGMLAIGVLVRWEFIRACGRGRFFRRKDEW